MESSLRGRMMCPQLLLVVAVLAGSADAVIPAPKHPPTESELESTNDLGKWAVHMGTNDTDAVMDDAEANKLMDDQEPTEPPGRLPSPGSLIPLDGHVPEVIWMDSLLPFVPRRVGMAVSR